MTQWNIIINGINHIIVFNGCTISGKAKLLIDDKSVLYSPILVRKLGMYYPFEIDGDELILKLDLKNNPVGLIHNGKYIDSGLPIEDKAASVLQSASRYDNPLEKKEQVGMGSFLTFVILTYVNLVLLVVKATIIFPFSAYVPWVITATAFYGYDNNFIPLSVLIICFVASLIIASIYLMLYLFSKKYTWPVITAMVLMIIDTLILILMTIDSITSSIVDILFHIWVIWSFVNIIRGRKAFYRNVSDNQNAAI